MKQTYNNKLIVLLLGLFCLLIIGIWFKDGKLLATGEEGLMLINPLRNIELYKYSWSEIGWGGAGPGSNVTIPFYHLEWHILNAGVPVWLFQAAIFFSLMFIGSCSIFFLTKELLKDIVKRNLQEIALVAGLFYILNPVSLLGVWYRFLLGFMFFYALAPMFLYLFIVGLNHKLVFVILLPLITLFFSFGYSAPSSTLLLWLLPFLYCLVISKSKTKSGQIYYIPYPLLYFFSMLFFWVMINLWWITPFVDLSKYAFSSETSIEHAVGTLKANSKDFTIDNVIRLIHGGFLYRAEVFGSIYKTPLFIILSWLIPIFTLIGVLKLKKSKEKLFLIISMVLLLFLVKGTSFPFGFIYLWFFKISTIFQLYRNPLEKIGMLLPIVYAPLFGFGLFYLSYKMQNLKKRVLFLVLVLILLGIFHSPFFSGALASFGKRDIRVVVPSSFKAANQFIPVGNHVILSIPMMGGASGFYKWQYGYKGVESSQYLFNYPVITSFYDATSFTGQLLIAMSNNNLHNLTGLAQLFSADIVAYRKDTDVAAFGYNLDALERSEKMINESNLTKIFDSKEVSLWTLPQETVVPLIYTPQSIKFGESPKDLITLLENDQFDPRSEVFICTNKDKCNPYITYQDTSQVRIQATPEKVEFKKISPTYYDVKIESSKGRFLLVFNRGYHPGWTALVEGKSIDENKHIIANGYANGFLIDKEGSFNLSLKFTPEEKINTSYKISYLAILFGVIMVSGGWIFSLFKHD